MNSSSQATSLVSNVVNASEPLPLRHWEVTRYFSDDVEEYGATWTADDAAEEEYYCRPRSVVCYECWTYGHGTQHDLENKEHWTLCTWGEMCGRCAQRAIDADMRPEDVLRRRFGAPIDTGNIPF